MEEELVVAFELAAAEQMFELAAVAQAQTQVLVVAVVVVSILAAVPVAAEFEPPVLELLVQLVLQVIYINRSMG